MDYRVVDNFLQKDFLQEIKDWAKSKEISESSQRWGKYLTNVKDVSVKIPKINKDAAVQSNILNRIKNGTDTDEDRLLYKYHKKILGVFKIPDGWRLRNDKFTSLVYSWDLGSGILMHRDSGTAQSKNSNEERVAFTFYLIDKWDPNWGGELITFKGSEDKHFEEYDELEPSNVIYPKYNRLAINGPDGGWHKVSPVLNKNISRFTIQSFLTLEKIKKHKTKPVVFKRGTL